MRSTRILFRYTVFTALVCLGCTRDTIGPVASAGAGSNSRIFLARISEPPAYMESLFIGQIVADAAGCLRIDSPSRATVIWPSGYTLNDEGTVMDGSQRKVGSIGESFRLAGGEVEVLDAERLSTADRTLAASRCPGQYWIVSP